jgi:DNA-binding NarL/FixJ family response regulator
MNQQPEIRLLVVDDHKVVREGLISMLEAPGQIRVIGQAADAQEAIGKAIELRPDVILLDIRLPGRNGVEVCKALRGQIPNSRVIMLTSFEDEDYLFEALQAGAWGYLIKTASREEIVEAVTSVAGGKRLLSAPLVDRLVTRFAQVGHQMASLASGFDQEELEILRLLAEGSSNKEIAHKAHWSEISVKRKLQVIFDKLCVDNRTSAVIEARRRGLV